MTFFESIRTVIRKYADFTGTASRSEFWWWMLFDILVLAAGSAKEGPGPLVTSLASRAQAFPIPVTVIPDLLTDEELDAMS